MKGSGRMASTIKTVKTETIVEVTSNVIDVTGTDAAEALAKFQDAKKAIKALEDAKAEAEARLREILGDAEIAVLNGQELYKLAHRTNSRVDKKLLTALAPELVDKVTVVTPYDFIQAL